MANTLSLRGVLTVASSTTAVLTNLDITENGTYTPPEGYDGFDEVVANVPQPQPVIESKNITANGTYTAPSGVDGFSPVVVNVPQSQPVIESKNITANGTYTAPSGVDGFSPVVVNVPAGTEITINGSRLQISSTSDYATSYFTNNLVNGKWYLISVFDPAYNDYGYLAFKFDSSVPYMDLTINVSSSGIQVHVTNESITGSYYSGNWRDIYCRVCEIPTEMEVPM